MIGPGQGDSNARDTLSNIVARAQAGDASSFDALVDTYANRLYGYFFRLTGSRSDAEDLLQDLFVRLVQAIRNYDHRNQFDGFLFRIATNLYRDRLRARKRSGHPASLDDLAGGAEVGVLPIRGQSSSTMQPLTRMERAEEARLLQTALGALPAHEREVIVLRHFSSMSFKDIAAVLGAPLGTVLARAHRGLTRIRQMFEGQLP